MSRVPAYQESVTDGRLPEDRQQLPLLSLGRLPATRRLIRELPATERPSYRIQHAGPRSVSNTELLAAIMGTPDALTAAEELLVTAGGLPDLMRWSRPEYEQVNGVGAALAVRIMAAMELGRRATAVLHTQERVRIVTPADAANLLMPDMMPLAQEHLRLILLNTRNEVISTPTVYIGSLNSSVVRLGELMRCAIVANAAAMIVVHNHPSGDPSPSPEDVNVTKQMVQAGKLMDIAVLDHVIIGHGRFTSLKERGLGFDS